MPFTPCLVSHSAGEGGGRGREGEEQGGGEQGGCVCVSETGVNISIEHSADDFPQALRKYRLPKEDTPTLKAIKSRNPPCLFFPFSS